MVEQARRRPSCCGELCAHPDANAGSRQNCFTQRFTPDSDRPPRERFERFRTSSRTNFDAADPRRLSGGVCRAQAVARSQLRSQSNLTDSAGARAGARELCAHGQSSPPGPAREAFQLRGTRRCAQRGDRLRAGAADRQARRHRRQPPSLASMAAAPTLDNDRIRALTARCRS